MRIFNLTIITFITAGTILCSCGARTNKSDSSASSVATDSLPVDVSDIVNAVATDDSSKFSSHVNYPLERPYPLKDINNEDEMKAYYNVMVDDSLKNVITKSSNNDWTASGWRGWTVKDGQYLWIDGDIYEVNYLSPREKSIKDSLVRREKASLPPALAKGWVPEWVMEDVLEGTVYRIDADSLTISAAKGIQVSEGGEYRLSIYRRGRDLRSNPERVVKGKRRMDGSVGNVNYYFDNHSPVELSDSAEYVIELYSETGSPRLYHRKKKGETQIDHELKKVYWLDIVGGMKTDSIGKR